MSQKFYAVKAGRVPGIYFDWDSCNDQVTGYKNASFKSFKSLEEACGWLGLDPGAVKAAAELAANEIKASGGDMPTPDPASAIAYVDGSYNDAIKKFSYGIVLFINTLGLNIDSTTLAKACNISEDGSVIELHYAKSFSNPELLEMRNVAGEIMGAAQAMKTALEKGCTKISVYHDYEGIAKWCLGQWKTNKVWTKKYKDFYDGISKKIRVDFVKVKAHSKVTYNEIADELAKSALE